MTSVDPKQLAKEIFDSDQQIIHLGMVDLKGNVLLDQSSAASTPSDPDPGRKEYYGIIAERRNTREHFDEVYGKTDYIHVIREKMQQMILYLPEITAYLTLEKSMTPEEVKVVAQKIKLLDSNILESGI